jgi:hypothetical protein
MIVHFTFNDTRPEDHHLLPAGVLTDSSTRLPLKSLPVPSISTGHHPALWARVKPYLNHTEPHNRPPLRFKLIHTRREFTARLRLLTKPHLPIRHDYQFPCPLPLSSSHFLFPHHTRHPRSPGRLRSLDLKSILLSASRARLAPLLEYKVSPKHYFLFPPTDHPLGLLFYFLAVAIQLRSVERETVSACFLPHPPAICICGRVFLNDALPHYFHLPSLIHHFNASFSACRDRFYLLKNPVQTSGQLDYLTKVLPSLPLLLSVGFSSATAIEIGCAFLQAAHLLRQQPLAVSLILLFPFFLPPIPFLHIKPRSSFPRHVKHFISFLCSPSHSSTPSCSRPQRSIRQELFLRRFSFLCFPRTFIFRGSWGTIHRAPSSSTHFC